MSIDPRFLFHFDPISSPWFLFHFDPISSRMQKVMTILCCACIFFSGGGGDTAIPYLKVLPVYNLILIHPVENVALP